MRLLIVIALCVVTAAANAELLDFSKEETRNILRHGPWPMPWSPDPSNRVSGNPAAIELGELLFSETRLSKGNSLSCAGCHVSGQSWQDGRTTAVGLHPVDRNTLSLLNVHLNHWFGWDGANDSLWSQTIRPLLDPREMNSNSSRVARVIRKDRNLRHRYEKIFGAPPTTTPEIVMVNAAKALAAFQETLTTGRTEFDEFRDALERNDRAAAARYPIAAQRGLRIFIGKGNCNVCHFGPNFTNGEFADVGVPFFIAPGRVDPGRYQGIEQLKQNRMNLLGKYNDDAKRETAIRTRHIAAQHRNFGEFRVPSLRNVAQTAPYMHNGRLPTLRDVVKYYSEIDPDRLHADGTQILRPLNLSNEEIGDVVVFLETLTEKSNR